MADWILQRPSDKAQRLGVVAIGALEVVGDALELSFVGCGLDGVARSFGDEVYHLEAFALKDFAHVYVRLKKDVLISDGCGDGNHRRVRSEPDGVEHTQAVLLMLGKGADFDEAGDWRLGKPVGIDVAAVGAERRESAWMLEAQMPSAGSAHRHPAQYNALTVNVVVSANGFNGLENVCFARPSVTVFDPSEGVEFDEGNVWPRAILIAFLETFDEAGFTHADGLGASVEDDIQSERGFSVVPCGDNDSVGLHGAVYS